MGALITQAPARSWVTAVGLCFNNGLDQQFPDVRVPTCSSELSSVCTQVIAYAVNHAVQ